MTARQLLACLASMLLISSGMQAASITDWTGAVDSSFANDANWTSNAPNTGTDATVSTQGNQPVVTGVANTQGLTIGDATAVLQVNPGSQLYMNGVLNNSGTLSLTGSASGAVDVVLTGTGNASVINATGQILMSDSSNNRLSSNSGTNSLTNNGNITGSGGLTADFGGAWALNNNGTVTALSATGNTLTITSLSSSSTNTGTLQGGDGTNVGSLTISNTTIDNTAGTILSNAGSNVTLANSAVINGGAMTLTGGGTLTGSAQFNGASLNGPGTLQVTGTGYMGGSVTIDSASSVNINPASLLYAGAGLLNNGGIQLSGNGAGNADFVMTGSGTVTNAGTIGLSNNSNNRVTANSSGVTLLNSGSISGAGSLNTDYGGAWTLNNTGTVTALSAGNTNSLNVNNLGVTNTGTLQAGDGVGVGTLSIYNSTVNNAGGTIRSNTGSTVTLAGGSVIDGGTLTGTGTLQIVNSATLNGAVTIDSGATVTVNAGSQLHTEGTGLLNNGTIQLNGNGAAYADIIMGSGPGTVTNAGNITLGDHTNNRISSNSSGITLLNSGTISGSGGLNSDFGPGWALNNTGTVTALSAVGNTLSISNLGAGSVNTGTIQAGDGINVGALTIANTTINNTGATLLSNAGSNVTLANSAVINGGTMTLIGDGGLTGSAQFNGTTLNGSGTLQVSGAGTMGGSVTIDAATTVHLNAASQLSVNAGLTNNGAIGLSGNGAAYADLLLVNGPGTVTNTGSITLGDHVNNRISSNSSGITLLNSGTISGSGGLNSEYGGAWALNNTGTVTALSAAGNALTIANLASTSANSGTMQAGDGTNVGALTISHTTINNTGGTILSNAGSNVTLTNSAVINGGTMTINGDGELSGSALFNGTSLNGTGTLQVDGAGYLGGSVTIDSATSVHVNAGGLLAASAGLINNGAIKLTGNGAAYATLLLTDGPGTVTNAGTITLADHPNNRISSNSSGITLLNSGVISGAGGLNTDYGGAWSVNNTGSIIANGTNAMNIRTGGSFTNSGTLQANAGSQVNIGNTTFSNFSAQTLTGGTYTAGGIIQFTGADVVNNAATIQMTSAGARIQDDSGTDGLRNFTNNTAAGDFDLKGGYSFNSIGTFANAGAVNIFTGSTFNAGTGDYNQSAGVTQVDGSLDATNVNVNGGVLKGTGTVNGNVTVNDGGHVAPGDSPGVLTANSYTQNEGGELDILIGGATAGTQYSVLDITTTVLLSGILNLTSIDSYTPFNGQIFDILHAGGSVSGTFSSVIWANLAPGLSYSVIYNANSVQIDVTGGGSEAPEPSTWLMMASALLAGLVMYRRREGLGFMKNILSGIGGLAIAAALLFGGWTRIHASGPDTPGYHAVLLDNNQVYFGKLSGLGTSYPLLTDVYYVQSTINPETKQTSNILLKRGKEWHAPDKMYLSAPHILMVEPVTKGSMVSNLINQSAGQK